MRYLWQLAMSLDESGADGQIFPHGIRILKF
jgi:hypothetical protein